MKLWVCCGHGAGDSGAVGGGYTEAERVRALGARIKALGGDSVVLMDTSKNWYASRGFDTVNIPRGDAVVELHMDSAGAGARGAHVIYNARYKPDAYDSALASKVAALFPGRANKLSARSDLRNCNICANRGINYRLVENGFISDATDRNIFNSKIDTLAKIYLDVFGIKYETEEPDMTDAQAKQLSEVHHELTRTDDPSGRGVKMNMYTHEKHIAGAVQWNGKMIETICAKLGIDIDEISADD